MGRSALVPLLFGVALSGCGGGGGGIPDGSEAPPPPAATKGVLEVRLHDAPIEGAEHVFVTIERVDVFRKDGDEEIRETVQSAPGQYDLLELQDGVEAVLGGGTFEPGLYKWIRLVVAKDSKHDIRHKPADQLQNYIVVDGVAHPLQVPSGHETGLKLGKNFRIEAGMVTVLTLDFDVRESVNRCGKKSKHQYRLKPRIRVIPTSGEPQEVPDEGETPPEETEPVVGMAGTVATSDGSGLPMGTVVSIQQDGVAVATAEADQTTGAWSVAALEDGTYDVVVIAPFYDYALETDVTVTSGTGGTSHDFTISPANAGALYGWVDPVTEDTTVRVRWNGVTVATVGADPSDGFYVFDTLPAGDYEVEATDGSSTQTSSATVDGGSATQVDFSL
jgi:hypothetical protein